MSPATAANLTDLLERAAELNEDGVYELADGCFSEAVQSFENAVRHMMQVCQITTASTSDATNNGGSQHKQLETPAMLPPPARSSVEVPFLTDDRFYIYACTVTFQPSASSTDEQPPSSPEIAFYCATILFNLAIAHHQQGQKQQTSTAKRDASLRQALCLYQEVARTLQCLTPCLINNSRDDILLMTLAISNNQAQILYRLHEERATSTLFQQLLQQSMAALQTPTNNFSIFEQSLIHEFIRNAMVFGTGGASGGEAVAAAACA